MTGTPEQPDIVGQAPAGFCVVAKPAGWTVQRSEASPGLLHWLRETLGAEAYPVHRLDAGTTGLVLFALTEQANRALSQAFAERRVRKTYLAVSDKAPRKKQGWVRGDMAPSRRGQWKLLRSQKNPAITAFQSVSIAPGVRGFVLLPKTGKTHQLRVALKSLGSPIIGDARYGGSAHPKLHLHAWRLGFTLNGKDYEYELAPSGGWFDRWCEQGLPETATEATKTASTDKGARPNA
ncbi:MAG: pseudouridine synthase [Saccharospirillum sp.]